MVALQLNLFSSAEPEWDDITINWLLEYLNMNYPELKFKFEEDYDGDKWIEQSVCKKVRLSFYIDRYDKCVPTKANQKFIGGSSERNFGAFCGQTFGFDSMEELRQDLSFWVENFWKNVSDYKDYKKKGNKNGY